MIFRLRDFIRYPLAIRRFRRLLEESQYWPLEGRSAWVRERLRRTLEHAVDQVPYYRRVLGPVRGLLEDACERMDLSPLPMLGRADVRREFDGLRADRSEQYDAVESHTSGSTGTSMRFLLDRGTNILEFASLWRVLNWAGYRFGNRFASLHGRVTRRDRLFEHDRRTRCLYLSSFNFRRENIRLYLERLAAFRPVLLKAYPSSIDLLARWVRADGGTDYRPPAIVTSSETLLDHQREAVRSVFGCPIYDFYGQNERAALISTCEHGRYHIHEEYSFVEIVKEDGRPAAPGETGEIVTTSLHNRAMPLIRYRTGDRAIAGDDTRCRCGRTYRTVERVIGRIEDIVVTPDGRHVGRLDAAFKYSPGIRLSQIVQETPDALDVRIVRAEGYGRRDEAILMRELRNRLGEVIDIHLRYVDSISPGENGKMKFVVSRPGRRALAGMGLMGPKNNGENVAVSSV